VVYTYDYIDTLVTPGGTLSLNDAIGDTYRLAPKRCSGLGMAKVRTAIYPKGQTHGFILGTFFLEGLNLLLAGDITIRSVSTEQAVRDAREAMCVAAVAACSSILDTTGTLNFVGGTSLAVKCNLAFEPQGDFFKSFVFGLVSASSS
jgi:hypothetical protein